MPALATDTRHSQYLDINKKVHLNDDTLTTLTTPCLCDNCQHRRTHYQPAPYTVFEYEQSYSVCCEIASVLQWTVAETVCWMYMLWSSHCLDYAMYISVHTHCGETEPVPHHELKISKYSLKRLFAKQNLVYTPETQTNAVIVLVTDSELVPFPFNKSCAMYILHRSKTECADVELNARCIIDQLQDIGM